MTQWGGHNYLVKPKYQENFVLIIAIITKSNPKQAIDLTIAHTKFGKDMSNFFP